MLLLPLLKTCSKCKINKPYIDFYKNKSMKDGYKGQCKECERQYYLDNFDEIKKKANLHYQQIKISKKEYRKKYDKTENGKLVNSRSCKRYEQSSQGKLVRKSLNHKRRILKLQNTPVGKHFIPADIKLKLKLQKGKCVYCQVSINKYYEIDHIIPVSKGGSNEESNIQLLCRDCNGTGGKWDKPAHEFAKKFGMLF